MAALDKAPLAARNAAVQAGAVLEIVATSAQVERLQEIVGLPGTLHADSAGDAGETPDTR